MPYIDITFEPLPAGGVGRQIQYREERDESKTTLASRRAYSWTELCDRVRGSMLKTYIATDRTVIVRSTVWDKDGVLHVKGAKDYRFSPPSETATEKPVPKPEDTDNVQVTQDDTDTAIDVDVFTPKDERPGDYAIEVRTSPSTVTDPKDAWLVTRRPQRFRCSCKVKVPVCPDLEGSTQRVWVRYIRENDQKNGEWSSFDIDIQAGERQHVTVKDLDTGDGFSAGTMLLTYGREELEEFGTALRFRALEPFFNTVWNDQSMFGMDTAIPVFGMDVYMPIGRYTGAVVDAGVGNSLDVIPQMYPQLDVTSFVRPAVSIFGLCSPFRYYPRDVEIELKDPDGEDQPFFSRPGLHIFAADDSMRRDPFDAKQEVSISQDASVFTALRFIEPGRKLKFRAYKAQLTIQNPFGNVQLKISNWFIWRRYRNRKWEFDTPYTHAGNGQMSFTIPIDCRPRIIDPVIEASILEPTAHPVDVAYMAEVLSYTAATGVVVIRGKQTEEFTSPVAADLWGPVSFQRTFAAAPRVIVTSHESALRAAGGVDSDLLSASAVSGYSEDIGGGTTTGDVQGEAKGIPIGDGSTSLRLKLIVTGA